MQLVFVTLHSFSFIFLIVAWILGYSRHPHHVLVGMLANLVAVFCICLSLAVFVGVSKLVKEHVGRYDLDESHIDDLNAIFRPFFSTVLVSAGLFVVVGVLGGALLVQHSLVTVHGIGAVIACCVFIGASLRIYRFQQRLSRIVESVEESIPDPEDAAESAGSAGQGAEEVGERSRGPTTPPALAPPTPKEGFVSDSVDWSRSSTRGRAWIAAGATLLAATLHVEIAVRSLGWWWAPVALVGGVLIVRGLAVARRKDGEDSADAS